MAFHVWRLFKTSGLLPSPLCYKMLYVCRCTSQSLIMSFLVIGLGRDLQTLVKHGPAPMLAWGLSKLQYLACNSNSGFCKAACLLCMGSNATGALVLVCFVKVIPCVLRAGCTAHLAMATCTALTVCFWALTILSISSHGLSCVSRQDAIPHVGSYGG